MTVNPQDRYATEYAGDVVAFLVDQHEELKALMTRVLPATGEERRRLFGEVREMLARHEAAEEAVVRPLTQQAPGGAEQARARTGEEDRATRMLAFLEQHDVDSPSFEMDYQELQEEVLRHAEAEEAEEFPLLRRTHSPEALRAARAAVERAESGAPPRPGAQGQGHGQGHGHGTFATMLERARGLFSRS